MLNKYSTTIITGIPDRTTFLEWQRLAAEGDPAALNSLGAAYLNGWHVSVNPEEGVRLIRLAAEKGNLKARTNMGGFMVTGTYLPQDQCSGVSLIKGAAEEGFPPAMARLGSYYWIGIGGLPVDTEQALEWFRRSAEQDDPGANFTLGAIYDEGIIVEKDIAMGQALLTRAAELGYPQAQFKLGWRYDDGEGVPKNADSAMHWYRRAAESGEADAQVNLGVLLEGLDTPDSLNEAVFWLGLAAEKGETKAMTVLASIYFRGPHAIDQDMDKACLLLEQAIKCGDVAAKHLLYVIKGAPELSSTGDTDLPDDAAAVLECAQDATDAMAYLNIARLKLCSGEHAEAAYWLEIAAEQGVVYAQVELGAMYLDGLGVERDSDKARFWLSQAAEKGNMQAKTAIQMMGPT